MPRKKKRTPPTADELAVLLDDNFISCLAAKAKLPSHADIQRFEIMVRDAARQYCADITAPTHTEIRSEIRALYSAASRLRYKELATRMSKISKQVTVLLETRADNLRLRVPDLAAFTDCERKDEACKTIVRLWRIGWEC